MNYIFVVTSSLASPLQSFYTVEERYQQTLNTVNSIRRTGNHTILLCDNSVCLDYDNRLRDISDIFVKRPATPNKSIGEASLMLHSLNYITQNHVAGDIVYKISGRYVCTDKFVLNTDPRPSFRLFSDRVTTLVYSFGREYIENMATAFSGICKNTNYPDIERAVYHTTINWNINWISQWGVAGNYSSCGTYVEQ